MTKPTFFVEEDKILTALFDAGLDHLHICKPGTLPVYSERLLSLIPEEHRPKITVHDHYYLKEEYRLAGIHIDNPEQTAPLGYKGKVGRTCEDLTRLKEMKRKSNTVILRNIFDSQSEAAQKSCFTMNELERASRDGLIDKRVYAFGGMTIDNAIVAKRLGFGGVVIRGDLWNRFNIHSGSDYTELLSHFEKLRKYIG